jgi:hypothetical protein
MADAERVVAHAVFRYRQGDAEVLAVRGQTVVLTEEDLARGDKAGAFLVEPEAPVDLAPVESQLAHAEAEALARQRGISDQKPEVASAPPKPAQVANKAVWVEFAVGQGASAEDAEAATKAELVELYGG